MRTLKRHRHLFSAAAWLAICFSAVASCDSVNIYGVIAIIGALVSFGFFCLNANRYAKRCIND